MGLQPCPSASLSSWKEWDRHHRTITPTTPRGPFFAASFRKNVLRQPCRNGNATKSIDSVMFDGMARWSGLAVTEVCFTSRCYLLCQFCTNLALSARVTDGMELRYRGEREAQERGGGGRVKRCRLLLPVVSTKQRPALLSVNNFCHPPLPVIGPTCRIHPSRDTGRDIPTGVTSMR